MIQEGYLADLNILQIVITTTNSRSSVSLVTFSDYIVDSMFHSELELSWSNLALNMLLLTFLNLVIPFNHLISGVDAENSIYKPGDVILGGLFPIHRYNKTEGKCSQKRYNWSLQRLEAMLYAVDSINNDPTILK